MWILRFLNGPMAGQVVPMTKNSMLVGRAPNCDIKIPSPSISKEHTRIEMFDDKLIVSDAGSRNGTFINGVQVRSQKVKSGDKVGIHEILVEVQKVSENWAMQQYRQQQFSAGSVNGNAAYQMPVAPSSDNSPDPASPVDVLQGKLPQYSAQAQAYMENVVLPGIYRLPEMFEFKWVLAGVMAVFVLLVTTLSTIPLIRILRSSLQETSQQHAMTIANTLARVNIPSLAQGLDSGVSVEIALSRPGVLRAYVISNVDGAVIAPASQAGTYPDVPYMNEGRKMDKESVHQINDSTIVAMYPVRFYNADTGSQAVTAWAVVMFDMSSLAVDNRQVLSLYIATLFIALILGFILFYFLYKLFENPLRQLNAQLDVALKEGQESVSVTYQFPAMQLLASNVSSALSRAANGSQDNVNNRAMEHDRNREVANLVELIGFAAMGIRAQDLSIAAVNQAFEQRIGLNAAPLTTLTINELSDQSLKLSIKDLIEQLDQNPDNLASKELEFGGLNFQIVAQAVYGTSKIAYYLIVLLPKSEES